MAPLGLDDLRRRKAGGHTRSTGQCVNGKDPAVGNGHAQNFRDVLTEHAAKGGQARRNDGVKVCRSNGLRKSYCEESGMSQ